MKIICTQREYTDFIRMCQILQMENNCRGCIFKEKCEDNAIENVVCFDLVGEVDG